MTRLRDWEPPNERFIWEFLQMTKRMIQLGYGDRFREALNEMDARSKRAHDNAALQRSLDKAQDSAMSQMASEWADNGSTGHGDRFMLEAECQRLGEQLRELNEPDDWPGAD